MSCLCECHRRPDRRLHVTTKRTFPNPCLLCAHGGLCAVARMIRELDAAGVSSHDFARFVRGMRG